MPTGQAIINAALTAIGILEQGGTPSVSDSTDALGELNAMWDALQIDDRWAYSVLPFTGTLAANVGSYTIGTGATFNTTRPTKIVSANFVSTVGGSLGRRPLQPVNAEQYYAHGDLSASAAFSEEFYPDYNVDSSGFAKIYLWPTPKCPVASFVEIESTVPFVAWTLQGTVQIPYGYQDALGYALAWRLLPRYGAAVAQQVAEVVRDLGMKSEARIIQANAEYRLKPPPAPEVPPQRSAVSPAGMAAFQGLQPGAPR